MNSQPEIIIEWHPGRGYKVTQITNYVGSEYRLPIYATKKLASKVARMGGWKATDIVKVWTPLYGGYMPAYASQRGDGKNTLVFLDTDLLTHEFAIEDMPYKRKGY